MPLAFMAILVLGGTSAISAQIEPAYQGVDQAVSDYNPLQISMRRIELGNGQFNDHYTLRQLNRPSLGPIPVRLESAAPYGLNLPGNYLYRFPGMEAFIDKPHYLVRSGWQRRDLAFNQVPYQDGAFKDMASAKMVFNLMPQLTKTPVRPAKPTWIDTRLNGRVDQQLKTQLQVHAYPNTFEIPPITASPKAPTVVPTNTDLLSPWIDSASYWLEYRDRNSLLIRPTTDAEAVD